jgi:protocatechuate 3,4-dioxygenase beta subunit
VDELLNRVDVRTDTSSGAAQAGIPLALTIYLYSNDDDCTPYEGAVIDIWNANALGVYSDEASENSTGTNYLRGYQVTDSEGKAEFITNMPGWYSGRSMHVHVRVRTFDGTSSQTFSWFTQLFFGESVDSAVAATSTYQANPNGTRVHDTEDRVWKTDADGKVTNDGASVTVPLTGDTTSGYAGTFGIGLDGLPSTNTGGSELTAEETTGGGGSAGSAGSSGSSSSSGSTSAGTDTAVAAALRSLRWSQAVGGKKKLAVTIKTEETIAAHARLTRGGKVLAEAQRGSLREGTRNLDLTVARGVSPGTAKLHLALTDSAGNLKHLTRQVRVPSL